jgi:hypothetical protein
MLLGRWWLWISKIDDLTSSKLVFSIVQERTRNKHLLLLIITQIRTAHPKNPVREVTS